MPGGREDGGRVSVEWVGRQTDRQTVVVRRDEEKEMTNGTREHTHLKRETRIEIDS